MSGFTDSGHPAQFWGHCSFSPLSLFLEPLEIVYIYKSLFDVLFARSSDGIHSTTRKTILMFFQEMVIFLEPRKWILDIFLFDESLSF